MTRWWHLKYFLIFTPTWGWWSSLTNIFQMGWFNYQPDDDICEAVILKSVRQISCILEIPLVEACDATPPISWPLCWIRKWRSMRSHWLWLTCVCWRWCFTGSTMGFITNLHHHSGKMFFQPPFIYSKSKKIVPPFLECEKNWTPFQEIFKISWRHRSQRPPTLCFCLGVVLQLLPWREKESIEKQTPKVPSMNSWVVATQISFTFNLTWGNDDIQFDFRILCQMGWLIQPPTIYSLGGGWEIERTCRKASHVVALRRGGTFGHQLSPPTCRQRDCGGKSRFRDRDWDCLKVQCKRGSLNGTHLWGDQTISV